MFLLTFLNLQTALPTEFIQTVELLITFIALYGIIFYLLMTAENRRYFQKQK